MATQELVERYAEMMITKNWDLVEELVAPDYVRHDSSVPEPITSQEALREYQDYLAATYPDGRLIVEELIVAEDRAASRWRFMGTNTGSRGDMPATGRSVDVAGLSVVHIENGMVVEEWIQVDIVSLYEQLGYSIILPDGEGEEP